MTITQATHGNKWRQNRWLEADQAHVGFEVTVEDEFPAIVVGTHEDSDNLDLRVLLNGTDILWSPDAPYSPYAAAPEPGSWFWPPRA